MTWWIEQHTAVLDQIAFLHTPVWRWKTDPETSKVDGALWEARVDLAQFFRVEDREVRAKTKLTPRRSPGEPWAYVYAHHFVAAERWLDKDGHIPCLHFEHGHHTLVPEPFVRLWRILVGAGFTSGTADRQRALRYVRWALGLRAEDVRQLITIDDILPFTSIDKDTVRAPLLALSCPKPRGTGRTP